MKTRTAAAAILFLGAGIAGAEPVARLGLDDPAAAGPRIEADAANKVEGSSSLRITAPWPTTVHLGEVGALEVENARLVYSARVRTELQGKAYLEMWAHVGGGQYFSRGVDDAVEGRSDWKTISTPFFFQKGQKPERVTLNLVIEGRGKVWVDDVTLSREPLE